jgi:hypothetical protein
LEALYRNCRAQPANGTGSFFGDFWQWWKNASGFETRWAMGSAMALAAAAAGYLILRSSKASLIHYLEHNGFDAGLSPQIAGFCIGEVGTFVIFLALSLAVVTLFLSRVWSGRRLVWIWVLLSAVMIGDLSRADIPWIRYYNYKQKFTMNPVVDTLRHEPWEHRVASCFSPAAHDYLSPNPGDPTFGLLCHWWMENDYPVNDIELLEIDQAPRMPVLDRNYLGNFVARTPDDLTPAAVQWLSSSRPDPAKQPREAQLWNWVLHAGPAARMWRLTNTRYLFADAEMAEILNQFAEPPGSFRTVMRLNLALKNGVEVPEDSGDLTVKEDPQGALALIEFTRALPRAKLYANWQEAGDGMALATLNSRQFDPEKTVLIATNTPVSQSPANTNAEPGTVKITRYQSKDIVLEAEAKTPAVLLLNDRTGDFWNVWVDQKPSTVLRCNYIMQGVFVPAGRHTIEFRFQPPLKMLYASLSAFAFGVLLAGIVVTRHFMGPDGREDTGSARQSNC